MRDRLITDDVLDALIKERLGWEHVTQSDWDTTTALEQLRKTRIENAALKAKLCAVANRYAAAKEEWQKQHDAAVGMEVGLRLLLRDAELIARWEHENREDGGEYELCLPISYRGAQERLAEWQAVA